jgi:hypothetical protein
MSQDGNPPGSRLRTGEPGVSRHGPVELGLQSAVRRAGLQPTSWRSTSQVRWPFLVVRLLPDFFPASAGLLAAHRFPLASCTTDLWVVKIIVGFPQVGCRSSGCVRTVQTPGSRAIATGDGIRP